MLAELNGFLIDEHIGRTMGEVAAGFACLPSSNCREVGFPKTGKPRERKESRGYGLGGIARSTLGASSWVAAFSSMTFPSGAVT